MKGNSFPHLLIKTILIGYLMVFPVLNSAFACSTRSPEDFGTFFEFFNSNKEFAVTRTLYPYTWTTETEEETTQSVITKEGDSEYAPLAAFAKKNEMLFRVESVNREKAIVKMYAPNTGWSFRFNFLSKEGCWFLESATEISM